VNQSKVESRKSKGFLAMAVACASFSAAAQTFTVPPELWDRPRSGRAVVEAAPVRQAVDAALAQPSARLVVHHGAGPDALNGAEELRSWLIALAIEPARIALRSDLKPFDALRIEVLRD
jgi:hypothetical protein